MVVCILRLGDLHGTLLLKSVCNISLNFTTGGGNGMLSTVILVETPVVVGSIVGAVVVGSMTGVIVMGSMM